MALIKCSECGKQFSDKAKACPECGCPTEEIKNDIILNNRQSEVDDNLENKEKEEDVIKEVSNDENLQKKDKKVKKEKNKSTKMEKIAILFAIPVPIILLFIVPFSSKCLCFLICEALATALTIVNLIQVKKINKKPQVGNMVIIALLLILSVSQVQVRSEYKEALRYYDKATSLCALACEQYYKYGNIYTMAELYVLSEEVKAAEYCFKELDVKTLGEFFYAKEYVGRINRNIEKINNYIK